MTRTGAMALLLFVWLITSVAGGGVLALLAKRIHPSLNTRRLWLVYSALLAFAVAVVMAIGWW